MDKTKRSPDLVDLVGGYGRWQRDIFILIFFAAFPNSWQNMAVSFFAPEVDHWCARSPNLNISVEVWKNTSIPLEVINGNYKHSSCLVYANQYRNKTKECNKWEYDTSVFTSTIINQWDLVCKKEWYVSLSQSIYMTGFMVAEIIFGQLADKLGRRPVMLFCIALSFVAGLVCAFSVSFLMYATCRFFVAMGVSGLFTSAFVILMEIVGPEYRAIFGIAIEFGWATAYILLSCLAWLIKDSFYLQLALSIPVILLGACWWIPESPRWLLSQGRVEECEEILIKAALKNGKSIDNISSEIKTFCKVTEKEQKENTKSYTLLDLLKYPNMRKKTLNLCFNWCVNAFVYYALSLNTNSLGGGNIFITFFISGAVEFPAYILSIFILMYVGSKRPLIVTMIIGGLACILTIPIPEHLFWLTITLSMIGKFCIAASFAIIYVYSAEIFPTVVRNVGIGTCSTIGRIGSILSPFVKELGKATYDSIPFIIYGVISITSGALVLLLPETHNKPVPDTIEELEDITKESSQNKNEKIRIHN